MKTLLIFVFSVSACLGQYTAILGSDYPANSLGILNSKPSMRTGVIPPTGNCTAGLDLYMDTNTRSLYYCGLLNVWVQALDAASTYSDPSWLSALSANKISTGSLALARIAQGGATNGQALVWNGSVWAPSSISGSGGYATIQSNGAAQTQRSILNFIGGSGISTACVDDAGNGRTNCTNSADTAVMATRAQVAIGSDSTCIPTSGSGTAYACIPASGQSYPSEGGPAPYPNGARIMFRPDVNCGVNPTLDISSIGARRLYAADGISSPSCTAGLSYLLVQNDSLNGGAGGWVFPATGGTAVSALPPYLSLAGVLYLPGMYQATLPPTAGGGGWTVRGGSGTPALATTPNGALTLTPDAGGTAGNYQWQARTIGTTRQLTVVLAANVRGNSVCSVGTGRHNSGFPLGVTLTDNRNAGTAAVQGQAQFNGTTYQLVGAGGTSSQFTPDTPAFIRINITGGDVLIQRSMDYGLTWTTTWSRTQSDTFGGAVANGDQWMIGGVFQTGQVPVCTVLSWEAI